MDDRDPLLALAASVADGEEVDWPAAEAAAESRDARDVVAALRAIGEIGEAHRSLHTDGAPDPGSDPLDRWGHLEILGKVGQGSYGEVYRARDVQLDREVALKLLRPGAGSTASDEVALSEGRLLARVRHPNVATVHGADRRDGRVGIWMEFIAGRTLAELLREQGSFGPREAAVLGIELCRAVAAVHAQGIVHRDIKAQNVMREKGGRIVLTDFGIGKDLRQETTTEKSLSGTPLYLAPEVIAGGPATRQSDIYSLGVLLYHLVTRSFPVRGASLGELRQAHERGEVRLLRDARPDLPDRFVRVVERALARDPGERYASAGAFEKALAEMLEVTSAHRPVRRFGHRKGALAGLAAALVALLVGSIVIFRQPPRPAASARRDRILIGVVKNRTGVELFDSVQSLLDIELKQSPRLQVVSQDEIDDTLERMKKPSKTQLERNVAQEVAQRTGAGAVLTGSIDSSRPGFSLTLATSDPGSHTAPVTWSRTLTSDDRFFDEMDKIAAELRLRLGEPQPSIDDNQQPLEKATTRSLIALQLFTRAMEQQASGKMSEAIDSLKAALGVDDQFALAYSRLANYQGGEGRIVEQFDAAKRAYDLRDRFNRRESSRIAGAYHTSTLQYETAIQEYTQAALLDPDDAESLRHAAFLHVNLGTVKEGLSAARRARDRFPGNVVNQGVLVLMLAIAGQPDNALTELDHARELKGDNPFLYWGEGLARFVQGDTRGAETAFRKLAEKAGESPELESYGRHYHAQVLAYRGKLQEAANEEATELSLDNKKGFQRSKMICNDFLARLHLLRGDRSEARRQVAQLIDQLDDIPFFLKPMRNAALLEIRLRDLSEAGRLLERMEKLRDQYQGQLSRGFGLEVRGEIQEASGDFRGARDSLEKARGEWSDPSTLSSLAGYWTKQGRCDQAVPIYKELLEQKGWIFHEFFIGDWMTAKLELARCQARLGQMPEARASYDEFLDLWGKADGDIELVKQARQEREAIGFWSQLFGKFLRLSVHGGG